ncbi:MAG TPA: hypothetical protein VFE46_02235 [Pirellulales bacterium]|jgi:hypothetical protein|nr:hypothetical protein [Pirellulales bacterium]
MNGGQIWRCKLNRKQVAGLVAATIVGVLFCLCVATANAANDLPAWAKVLDPDILFYSWPYPVVSPDGKWVAYVSKGFVCICNIDDPKPRRLSEVPNTWTHVLAQPEYAYAEGDSSVIARKLDRDAYQKWVASVAHDVIGLQWTYNGDGVVFAYQGPNADGKTSDCEIRYGLLNGTVTSLRKINTRIPYTGKEPAFYISRDRKLLVEPNYIRPRPLIWNLTTNKPQATPFTVLTPSSNSDRWIGLEKDTREFVITDKNFEIVKRLGNLLPANRTAQELLWSPDERFVIWRYQVGFDYYSNWEGGWIDLEKNEQFHMTGSYMSEIVRFTGQEGEFVRVGDEGKQGRIEGLVGTGFHFQFFARGDSKPEDVWYVHFDPDDSSRAHRECPGSPFYFSADYKLFVCGMSRPKQPPAGTIFHLLDRQRHLWRMPGEDNGKYFTPYEVVGFADQGRSIIAHDERRLFSVPVSAIMEQVNEVKINDDNAAKP